MGRPNGKLQHTRSVKSSVNAVAFAPNGKTFVTVSGAVHLWDSKTRALKKKMNVEFPGSAVAYSPDGKTLAVAVQERGAYLLDSATGKVVTKFKVANPKEQVMSLAFSHNGKLVAAGTAGLVEHDITRQTGNVSIWDAHTGKLLQSSVGHTSFVQSVAFAPDGRTFASGSSDGSVMLWDVKSWKARRTLKTGGALDGIFSVAFSPDGMLLASGGTALRLWAPATGRLVTSLLGHTSMVRSVAFTPDGRSLVSRKLGQNLEGVAHTQSREIPPHSLTASHRNLAVARIV